MRGFKHIDRQWADAFASGDSIQIGTLASYREGEGERVDPLEGQTLNRITNARFNLKAGQALNLGGIFIGGGGAVSLRNVTTQPTLVAHYLFCCSTEPDENLRRQGQAIFEITDLQAFGECLRQAKPDVLRNMIVGEVSYEPRSVVNGVVLPHPFKKDPKFAGEKELRIVWRAVGPPPPPRLQLNCPDARQFIRPA